MALISTCITELRTDVSDDSSTRFTDTQFLNIFKKAIRRANRVAQRAGLQFAKSSATLTTVTSQAYVSYAAVTDFDVFMGLFRDADNTQLTLVTERDWERLGSSEGTCSYCRLDMANSRIYLAGTPSSAETLTLWYYPTIDVSAYTTASSMPWSGRCDDMIMEYVGLRLKNIDEMDATFDQNLLNDMEQQILSAYAPNSANYEEGRGWLADMEAAV